jgi:hypothetical protein
MDGYLERQAMTLLTGQQPPHEPVLSTETLRKKPRPLTHDERKAAEAAFRGEPVHPDWSLAACQVYLGIRAVMLRREAQTGASTLLKSDAPCDTPSLRCLVYSQ